MKSLQAFQRFSILSFSGKIFWFSKVNEPLHFFLWKQLKRLYQLDIRGWWRFHTCFPQFMIITQKYSSIIWWRYWYLPFAEWTSHIYFEVQKFTEMCFGLLCMMWMRRLTVIGPVSKHQFEILEVNSLIVFLDWVVKVFRMRFPSLAL